MDVHFVLLVFHFMVAKCKSAKLGQTDGKIKRKRGTDK